MSSSDSLSGLTKWLAREEWSAPFGGILALHVGPACEEAGIEFDEIAEVLGDHHFAMLWACAFEDFLTRDCGPDDRNIIDDYLKRRDTGLHHWQALTGGKARHAVSGGSFDDLAVEAGTADAV